MKIAVVGFNGKVGNTVVDSIEKSESHEVAFGVSRSAKNSLKNGVMVYSDFDNVNSGCDGIIDFSHRDNLSKMLNYAVSEKIPVVIGTTGLTEDDISKIEASSKLIPVLCSHNTGFGINIMMGILEKMAAELADFDIEIIEKHHNRKEDAPSGTSMMLLDSMKASRPSLHPIYSRNEKFAKRTHDEVGIHSVRGGNIISDHEVIFAGEDDILTLSHQALTDASFAKGAIRGLEYIKNNDCGLYSMADIIK